MNPHTTLACAALLGAGLAAQGFQRDWAPNAREILLNTDFTTVQPTSGPPVNVSGGLSYTVCGLRIVNAPPTNNRTLNIDHFQVRDHCNVTGKYRGTAHDSCMLKYKLTNKLPVILHNFRVYDSQFIMQEIGKLNKRTTLPLATASYSVLNDEHISDEDYAHAQNV